MIRRYKDPVNLVCRQLPLALVQKLNIDRSSFQETRKNCASDEASGCTGGAVVVFFFRAKAEQCHGTKKADCENKEFDNNWGNSVGLGKELIRTIGSTPTGSLENWAQQQFAPVPIK